MNIILASASPRRQELLTQIGLSFTVQAADIDESQFADHSPGDLVEALSRKKAETVGATAPEGSLIIAADTVVVLDGAILNKPRDEKDAVAMLTALSGRSHEVFTGLSILDTASRRLLSTHEITSVRFRPLSPEEIALYVQSGEPMDKAGAYGIQKLGALFVSAIVGDYFNVVGLPICRLGQLLDRFGIHPLAPTGEKV